jgi:serine protease Do
VSTINRQLPQLILFTLLFILLAACGGKGDETPTPASASSGSSVTFGSVPAAEEETAVDNTNQPTNVDPLLVTNLEDVRKATVRVAFEGSFLDYAEGEVLNLPNHGSGFIIDPSGIAVTNNHVVTGASFLEIWIEGEERPRNARVLGVSECSDLAVIDIDGDGFPYLAWYEEPISVGQTVYAAGFPLYGNTIYTLTRGVVAKEEADGETGWASVESVLQIDATIQGGNSGGPLVTGDGRVMAVNYAGTKETRENFSISRDAAIPVIVQLRTGKDVHSLGINGQALTDYSTFAGIWVSSVESGSLADRAGIRAGDMVTSLEGLLLATDGTMSDYCDILRTHDPEDTLSVEVWRVPTGEILVGQINGDELEVVGNNSAAGSGDTAVSNPPASQPSSGIVTITDETGILTVDVPARWANSRSDLVTTDYRVLQTSLWAAANVNNFPGDWSQPGLYFYADFTIPGSDALLQRELDNAAAILPSQCEPQPTGEYGIPNYPYGIVQMFLNCQGDTDVQVFIGTDNARTYIVTLMVTMIDRADIEALNPIFASLGVDDTALQVVTDNLPGNRETTANSLVGLYQALLPAASAGSSAVVTAVDDAAIFSLTVPETWQIWVSAYREGSNGRLDRASLELSPHSIDYTFDSAPGIKVSVDSTITDAPEAALDAMQVLLEACTYQGRQQTAYGLADVYSACNRHGAVRLNLVSRFSDGTTLRVWATMFDQADLTAVDAALASLRIAPLANVTMADVENGRLRQTRSVTITDASVSNVQAATYQVTLPAQWIPLHAPWWEQGTSNTIGTLVSASPDNSSLSLLETSGVFIGSSEPYARQYTSNSFLDLTDLSSLCAGNNGRSDISFDAVSGRKDTWTGCGSANMSVINIASETADGSRMVWFMFVVKSGETAVVEQVLDSFRLLN